MKTNTPPSATITVTIGLPSAPDSAEGQSALDQRPIPIGLGLFAGLPLIARLERTTGDVVLEAADGPEAPSVRLRLGGPGGVLRFDDGRQLHADRGTEGITLTLASATDAIESPAPLGIDLDERGLGLPLSLRAAAAAYAEADRPDVVAGLLLRWAWSRSAREAQACRAVVQAWWSARPAAERRAVIGWALAQAEQLIDALGGAAEPHPSHAPLDAAMAEALALERDALASSCALLFAVGEGLAVRQVERVADDLLRRAFAVAGPLPSFHDPALDALARRGAGWWCVSPGVQPPPLDADAFTVDADAELWLTEDIDAFEEEAAEAAAGGLTS